jgi:hypothetical protein
MLMTRDQNSLLRLTVLCLLSLLASSCAMLGIGTETAYVISEKMQVFNSNSRVNSIIGELRNGDRVTVIEKVEDTNRLWAKLRGPNGLTGWADARFLVNADIVEQLRSQAEEIRELPTQAVGKATRQVKLRLSADRASDDNSVFALPAGTVFEIVDRDRRPRQVSTEARATGADADDEKKEDEKKDDGLKYDEWYRVRVRDNTVLPAGWVYGGSIDLEVPDEIFYYASPGRRIVGWQKIGKVGEDRGREVSAWLVLEKELFMPTEKDTSGREDFDRVLVIAWDAAREDYYTPYREDVRGEFPAMLKMDNSRGMLSFRTSGQNDSESRRECTVEINEGKVIVTGLKAVTQRRSNDDKSKLIKP